MIGEVFQSMQVISNEVIENEINNINKPIALCGKDYNYDKFSAREFENLLYQIFRVKIDKSEDDVKEKFDKIQLMQGVGEQGRDAVLSLEGKNKGIIQCKKSRTNISKPDFAKEVIKFILNYIKDHSFGWK